MSPTAEARIASLEARVSSIEQRERDFYDRVYIEHKRDVEQQFRDVKAKLGQIGETISAFSEGQTQLRVRMAIIGAAMAITSGGITGVIGHVLG